MSEHEPAPAADLRVRIMRLDALAQGITTGLIAGIGVFVATNWLVLKGGPVVGPNLALLGQFFFGYTVTFAGSLIGFAWAFVYGCAAGYSVSRLYNWAVGRGWVR
jgi:hypothetical protein